jgi:hypothetical protein
MIRRKFAHVTFSAHVLCTVIVSRLRACLHMWLCSKICGCKFCNSSVLVFSLFCNTMLESILHREGELTSKFIIKLYLTFDGCTVYGTVYDFRPCCCGTFGSPYADIGKRRRRPDTTFATACHPASWVVPQFARVCLLSQRVTRPFTHTPARAHPHPRPQNAR